MFFYAECYTKSKPAESLLPAQSVDKPKNFFCGGNAAFFVFPLTSAAEKHLVSEKPLFQRFFKGTGVVLAVPFICLC